MKAAKDIIIVAAILSLMIELSICNKLRRHRIHSNTKRLGIPRKRKSPPYLIHGKQ